jgi:starch synthase (maltosyl-transferring)
LESIDRLDHVASMGFDIVYLPPIHPIGVTKRKGRNNATTAAPDDVGSPWAIGSPDGGHTDVHPELGTVDDVAAFATACRQRGMHLALDIAFQCSPDHPWVQEHPEWFAKRPDGSIQYAENPPKKYEDIFPLDFETEDWQGLWQALADVFRFWIDRGVTVFRVDNPHTKAFAFWEWALATLHAEHPETVFLAESFTRPRVMERLAKIGFNQNYTYFTWRQEQWDLREYFTDLATRTVDWFRPNAWPNTPDILTEQLQHGGRAVFVSRAILAATLSPSWGVYGPAFELLEHTAVREGSEEYLDSEKYQLRTWDLDRADSLAPLLERLNRIRHEQRALRNLHTLHVHACEDPAILCYSKTDPAGGAPVLVVVNLDPFNRHSAFVDVDLAALGLAYGSDYDVVDELGGVTYRWSGNMNFVDLAPWSASAHVFSVRATSPATDASTDPSEVTS